MRFESPSTPLPEEKVLILEFESRISPLMLSVYSVIANSLLPFVLLQRIKDEVERRKVQCMDLCDPGESKSIHRMPEGHEQFQKLLGTVRSECQLSLPASPIAVEQVNGHYNS